LSQPNIGIGQGCPVRAKGNLGTLDFVKLANDG
jgi:hypothetical protein